MAGRGSVTEPPKIASSREASLDYVEFPEPFQIVAALRVELWRGGTVILIETESVSMSSR